MNEWKTVRLGDYITEYSVKNKNCEDIPVYSVTNTQGFCTEYFSKDVSSKDKSNYKIVPRGYFAYNPSRINVGSVDWQRYEDRVIVSPLYNVFGVSNELDNQYLYYFIKSDFGNHLIKSKAEGSVRDNLKLSMLSEFPIPMPPLAEQKHIAAILDKTQKIIAEHKQMLQKYDTLIKSRFIEMFGDPVTNERNWEKVRLDSVADIKIGPFGSLLHQEDYITGGHALVNPSHIIDGRICTDEKLTISNEKYTELTPYHLQKHDVVMGRRGEMGRCAVVDFDGLLCGTGSLIIRTKGELKSDFIQKIISFPSYKKTIEDKAVGQTMPNLNVPIVSSFEIIKPPKEVQDNYYAFVQQIDKSKFAVQKSLEKTETLYKALMQQYFG